MKIRLTLTKKDGAALADPEPVSWLLRRQGLEVAKGQGACLAGGLLELDVPGVKALDSLTLECAGYKVGGFVLKRADDMVDAAPVVLNPVLASMVPSVGLAAAAVVASSFDITANTTNDWDWLVWETEGNPDPKYQRGGRQRSLGLYRLDHDRLRRAGQPGWAPAHTDGTLGGGFVKVAVLGQLDYTPHAALIGTLLPCFSIVAGKLVEPLEGAPSARFIVMPFNADDNASTSGAIGRDLQHGVVAAGSARRLRAELPRWSTASRSTIVAFGPAAPDLTPHPDNAWPLRPTVEGDPTLPQVKGDPSASTLRAYQADPSHADTRCYSVKTGAEFVATQSQRVNGKDLLEANSIHAMSRSNLVAGTMQRMGPGRFEARYQVEILSILLGSDGTWDGIQVREIGRAGADEVWFPALAVPSHGKAFAQAWQPGVDWVDFWAAHFAAPLGRAKAEMLACFGLQHMTSNAQNFLVAFDRRQPGSAARDVILRDIGDTLLNTGVFSVLRQIDPPLFGAAWDVEVADAANGIVLQPGPASIGGGYANPQITRIGAGVVFFFPPFLKGDLDTQADPARAAIVARWGVAHNEGFLAYMRDKVGYAEAWSTGRDDVPDDLAARIRRSADLSLSGKSEDYRTLALEVLQMPAAARRRVMAEVKAEIGRLVPARAADVLTLQALVAGHELMVCAEVHGYLNSAEGRQALRDLHGGGRAKPATGSSPRCLACGDVRADRPAGWYACGSCRSLFCSRCAPTLKFPAGTIERMKPLTEERRCGAPDCKGFATPIV